MRTTADILLHSVNPAGVELITWKLTYWLSIHAEFMTHRAFSRNAASSRAIPVEKMISAVRKDCALPQRWGANQKGMQAGEMLTPIAERLAKTYWKQGAEDAVLCAEMLASCGAHKQIANRPLAPYSTITVLATMTRPSLVHFFGLRAHPDAQPEFQLLAYRMLGKYKKSQPALVDHTHWHIPFGDQMPPALTASEQIQVATARCARVSYLTFENTIDAQKDLELFAKLKHSDLAHASAFEHCAQSFDPRMTEILPRSNFDVGFKGYSGWGQFRKLIPNEFMPQLSLAEIEKRRPDWISLDPDEDEFLTLIRERKVA